MMKGKLAIFEAAAQCKGLAHVIMIYLVHNELAPRRHWQVLLCRFGDLPLGVSLRLSQSLHFLVNMEPSKASSTLQGAQCSLDVAACVQQDRAAKVEQAQPAKIASAPVSVRKLFSIADRQDKVRSAIISSHVTEMQLNAATE
jgi:hypothetical protein